ncbi:hypothetical protein P4H66_03415 [Paenibacillus dokdonensis]|uniref:UTP--glucose-1-phosphate uridylyltransferase n=2 Tax=Paenibacillus dokdonensis TaxID=2567944 RepID=A0ABU6GHR5_9BACL|nr:hypothetical protein [Paenibacillus dokdonensis]MEC0238919.1 hypothetical protein [Paenibacillus dokdonensis]
MGRYILNPSIFPELEKIEKGTGGEYQLTDALRRLVTSEGICALELEGKRFDIGDKIGYVHAVLEMSLQREELRLPVLNYLSDMMERQEFK